MIRVRAKLIVKDRGMKAWRERHEKLARGGKPHVKLGVFQDSGSREDGLTNVQLAAIHEFGTSDGHVPERSFLRSAFNANHKDWRAMLRTLVRDVVLGRSSLKRAFDIVGARAISDVKKLIVAHIPPKLAESTVARKGSSTPLVDTGSLLNSLTWRTEV